MSRIFTTYQEVDDKMILYGFIAGFLLNAVIAGQMVRRFGIAFVQLANILSRSITGIALRRPRTLVRLVKSRNKLLMVALLVYLQGPKGRPLEGRLEYDHSEIKFPG